MSIMTPSDLILECNAWLNKPDDDLFAGIVARSSLVLGMLQRELAHEFEVDISTVSRWANGITKPHPRLQRQVVQSIKRKAEKAGR